MNPDDDWSALATAWRAQPIDVDALRRAALRRARRMKLMMVLDVVLALLALALALRLLVSGADFWPRVGIGIGLAALAASVLINYRLRRGLWQAANDSVAGLLTLQRARRRNAIRMALWGPLFLPLGVLSGLLIGRGTAPALTPAGWPLWLRLALAGGIMVAFGVGSLLYVRRQRRQIAAIDAHLAQMEPPA
jgi:hypothetical protein